MPLKNMTSLLKILTARVLLHFQLNHLAFPFLGGRSSGGSPRKMTSSHYAQISPLRGQGLPPASAMGLRNSDQRSLMAHSPAKSYFEVSTTKKRIMYEMCLK